MFGFMTETQCIVALGDTGLGKSSLLRLFCGNRVKVGHGSASCTTKPRIFEDEQDKNLLWMDTMGSNDSGRVLSDREIRRNIMYSLQQRGVCRVKIIWFVEKSSRATATLQEQAEYIASFGDYSSNNVWNGVLICVKENTLNPKDRTVQGVISAADSFGATGTPLHTIGYSLLESMTEEDREDCLEGMTDSLRKKKGYLMNSEVKQEVSKVLNQISGIRIRFENETCRKCGVTGDPRCIPARCHTIPRDIHAMKTREHSGKIAKGIIRFCPRSHQIKASEWKASSGNSYKCHGCSIQYESVYYCGECGKAYCSESSSMDWKYKAFFGAGTVLMAGCAIIAAPEVAAAYAVSEAVTAGVALGGAYVGAAGSVGAASAYEATHRDLRSKCCRMGDGYDCCLGLNTALPCAMACCGRKPGSNGCKKVCNACKTPWADGKSRGCSVSEEHQF